MAHVDASFVQQIFDIPKREWKPNIQYHRMADDLGLVLKYLNGDGLFMIKATKTPCPPQLKFF